MDPNANWAQGRFASPTNPTIGTSTATGLQDTVNKETISNKEEWELPLTRLRDLYLDETIISPPSGTSLDLPDPTRLARKISINTEWAAIRRSQATKTSRPSSSPSSASVPLRPDSAQSKRISHNRHPEAGPSSGFLEEDSELTAAITNAAPFYVHPRISTTPFPAVRKLIPALHKRILITGGAGFLGSHLVDRLMMMGHDVLVLDNFFTGQKSNLSHWIGHPNFELVRHDVVNPIMIEVDQIYHLACPASPQHYQANQIKTIKTNFMGTSNMLGLAKRTKARFLLASTSEVYGDPDVSPQKETYNGNVNQTGPRACYDEGKRVAETLTYGYHYQDRVDVRVARIFNTYGPRINPFDGRVMSNFLIQALKGKPLTVYGDGSQTRSFCFIHDLIDGMIALMNVKDEQQVERNVDRTHGKMADVHLPVNLGNSKEFTIRQLVDVIFEVVDWLKQSGEPALQHLPTLQADDRVQYLPMPVDDPRQRRPDIERAKSLLGWEPKWQLKEGIKEMALYYIQQIKTGQL